MMELLTQHTEQVLLLKYFSMFQHPLKYEELLRFSGDVRTAEELRSRLDALTREGIIRKIRNFYLYDGDEKHIRKRMEGEKRADMLLPYARKAGKIISLFPFVRFVGISGSLSKGYAGPDTDCDFFIITSGNALWICRTFLHIFKKITFLFGKQHFFCMNYFVDERYLKLEEQNMFTRIELSTLIPVYNTRMYSLLLYANREMLPNLKHLPYNASGISELTAGRRGERKWLIPLNLLLMRLTNWKWKRKWKRKNYPEEDYSLAFKTTPYVSKNHPKNYQKKILNQLNNS